MIEAQKMSDGLYHSGVPIGDDPVPRLRQSTASLLVNDSPLHGWYKHFHEQDEEFNSVTNRGQLCHALLLGGAEIVSIDAPDWRTKAAKEQRDEAIAAGKIPVLTEKLADANDLKASVDLGMKSRGIILDGWSEVSAIWTRLSGIRCQGRMDHFSKDRAKIYDFKFTQGSIAKSACERSMISFGYDVQHAAYIDAIEHIIPELAGKVTMDYIFVQVDPPYAMRVMPVGGTMRRLGEWKWARACEIWQECLEKYGIDTPWPSYADDGEPAEAPAWALNQELTDEVIREGGNL